MSTKLCRTYDKVLYQRLQGRASSSLRAGNGGTSQGTQHCRRLAARRGLLVLPYLRITWRGPSRGSEVKQLGAVGGQVEVETLVLQVIARALIGLRA